LFYYPVWLQATKEALAAVTLCVVGPSPVEEDLLAYKGSVRWFRFYCGAHEIKSPIVRVGCGAVGLFSTTTFATTKNM